MALKVTRVSPGNYLTVVNGETYAIFEKQGKWHVVHSASGKPFGLPVSTKKVAVTALEMFARTKRTTEKTMKVARRREFEVGTELHVEGFRGRVIFLGYTRSTDGSAKDFIEIYDAKGRSRLADPAKITQVHRTRQRKDWIPR